MLAIIITVGQFTVKERVSGGSTVIKGCAAKGRKTLTALFSRPPSFQPGLPIAQAPWKPSPGLSSQATQRGRERWEIHGQGADGGTKEENPHNNSLRLQQLKASACCFPGPPRPTSVPSLILGTARSSGLPLASHAPISQRAQPVLRASDPSPVLDSLFRDSQYMKRWAFFVFSLISCLYPVKGTADL